MADNTLEDKIAYFKEHKLMDSSDEEPGSPDSDLVHIQRVLDGVDAMPPPPPKLLRRPSSFLGQPPKKLQAEFDAHTAKRRAVNRVQVQIVDSSAPALTSTPTPVPTLSKAPPVPKQEEVPFYKRFGAIPRELKMGRNVKLANDIKLEPNHKQLFKGKIICILFPFTLILSDSLTSQISIPTMMLVPLGDSVSTRSSSLVQLGQIDGIAI